MKKLTLFVIIIFLLIGTFGQEVFAQKTKSGLWNYFTQDKNITNLSTQLPAQKGLLKKVEDDGIKSIGNYQEKTSAPRTHFEFNISIHKEKNRITLKYGHKPEGSQINHRIPIFQQIFREDVPNTHIYFILPKKMILTKEMQTIITINNMTEKLGFLSACSPEDTKLSQLLKKYNATIEGTYNLTSSEKTELERAFDNTTDIVGGKVGKVAEGIKRVVKWGIERDESKRLQNLIKKYGTEYQIYKMPFYVPEGITLAYTHIGRQVVLAFNLSELTESTKVFIEIPKLTFELDVNGAMRKANIEGLAYEIMVEPYYPPEPDYTVESLYGEWEEVTGYSSKTCSNHLIISKNHIKQQYNPRKAVTNIDKHGTINSCGENNKKYVMREESHRGTSYYYIEIVSPNIICYEEKIFKKMEAQKPKTVSIDKIIGIWKLTTDKSNSITFKINKNSLICERIRSSKIRIYNYKIIGATKIDNIYLIRIIYIKKDSRKKRSPRIFCIKVKDKNIIYLPQSSIQLRRKASYQINKPKNPIPFGSVTLTYVYEDFNVMCLKLKNDGTYSTVNKEIDGDYEVAGIEGKYRIRGNSIFFTQNGEIVESRIEGNFLIDPNGARWIRVK